MKKLLITGFDAFGGETRNPSWEAVERLNSTIGDYALTKLQLPTVYGKAAALLLQTAEELQPDAILSVGQAAGRSFIAPEVVGINLREAAIPDNEGNQSEAQPIVPDGPAAYFSTLPVRNMVAAIKRAGLPARLSYSAGAFVCNDLLYTVLHHYRSTAVKAGFVHVPCLPEQAKEGCPSMCLEDMVRGLEAGVEGMDEHL